MPQFSDDLFLGTAQTYMGITRQQNIATVTGSIATTNGGTLTVTALLNGQPLQVGMMVNGTGVTAGTFITALSDVITNAIDIVQSYLDKEAGL